MTEAITTLQEMGVVGEKDGALIADLTKYKLEKTVVRKKGKSRRSSLDEGRRRRGRGRKQGQEGREGER